MMKKTVIATFFLTIAALLCAQTTENYKTRYNSLVSRVGFDGVGVETLLDKWEKADPSDVSHMVARFNYYLTKSMRDSLVVNHKANYLGLTPLLEMKDSTGRKVYYYNEKVFEPQYFAKAVSSLDQAISIENDRLDIILLKADALASYEKTVPDLSLDLLLDIVDRHFTAKSKWNVPGEGDFGENDFLAEIQNFALLYYNTASEQSYDAFRRLNERVLKYRPKQTAFLDNMGAYYVSAKKDDKKALKYFTKAAKIDPEDTVAKQNISLINRRAALKKKK